jgi:hypothetical protein
MTAFGSKGFVNPPEETEDRPPRVQRKGSTVTRKHWVWLAALGLAGCSVPFSYTVNVLDYLEAQGTFQVGAGGLDSAWRGKRRSTRASFRPSGAGASSWGRRSTGTPKVTGRPRCATGPRSSASGFREAWLPEEDG